MVYLSTVDALEWADVLYEDKFIKVTSQFLVIRHYYFLGCGTKCVAITDIERFWHGSDPCLKLRLWKKRSSGIGLSCIWWALAPGRLLRQNKCEIVIKLKGTKFSRIGFSTDEPTGAYLAIEQAVNAYC